MRVDGAEQVLEIVRQPRHLGGTQAYWTCPRCEVLRSHLYVRDGALACRRCHYLDYRSRHVLHPAVIRAAKLRRKLRAARGLLAPLPPRLPYWRRDYYARLVAELVAAEAVIAARLHDTLGQVRRRSERDGHSNRAA